MKLSSDDKILFSWFQHEEDSEGTYNTTYILMIVFAVYIVLFVIQVQSLKDISQNVWEVCVATHTLAFHESNRH